ncbi:MAG: HAD-IC family P-type ATPase [Clostridia bacterium]|nr:HAD-IC family P-type ATPase [Clostridia bacterium]
MENIEEVKTESASESTTITTDINQGLTLDEVEKRKAEGKINGDQNVKTKSVGQILRENLITFFNFVFIALAVILCFFVDWQGNVIKAIGNFGFMLLIIFNALVGIFQELRAKKTIDKLSILSAPKIHVLRNGQTEEIKTEDIVLDDIVILSSGSQIVADSVVAEGQIEVNESLITGEPDAILKQPGDPLTSGSFVVSGKAKAQVIHIGQDNFAAKISAGAKYFKKPNSEIWRSLMLIVKVMAIIIVPLGIALFLVKYLLQGGELNETVMTTIGTIIGMIPSGLVALSSTVFCVSVIRLSQKNTLAQDLYCVETLARVDVLCLDKTGTITEGTMEVNEILPENGNTEDEVKQIIKNVTSALADDNATANALRDAVKSFNVTGGAEEIVPFSSQRKWSGARINGTTYVIGAPEFVFKNQTDEIKSKTAEMAEKGFRVMVIASSTLPFDGSALPQGELKLESFIFITDKIRAEAPDTLRFFKEEGVNVKIISGDNPATVRAVAKRAGLEDCDNIIDMSTLHTEEEVYEAAEKYTIFGRVLPDQKLMLVKALKKEGHTVAMTGDGVNDVLALKEADCSIAMASGSDAAKNVSSLVLLDSNFASMPKVVAEGRRSINNLERSAALYIMKTLYNTLLAILFLCITDPLPFAPQNLTLMGGVTIGMPSIVLALEPNHDRVTGRFLPKVLKNCVPGSVTVLFAAIACIICNRFFLPDLTTGQSQTIFIILTTFCGFLLLFKVALPFNVVHGITYLAMIGIFIACYLVKLPGDLLVNFFGLDTNLTWEMGKAILSMCAVVLPLYLMFVFIMYIINKKTYDKFEDKFTRLDNFLKSSNFTSRRK